MKRRDVSFKISDEDSTRLTAIANALHVDESEVLHRLLQGEYSSWNLDAIAQSEMDPEDPG